MPRQPAPLPIDELDLRDVAMILTRVFPHLSSCECARMVATVAPDEGCVCTLCGPGVYPRCMQQAAHADGTEQVRFRPAA